MQLDKLRILILTGFRTQQAFGLATNTDPSVVTKVLNGIRTIPADTARRWEIALELKTGNLNSLVTNPGRSAWIFIDQRTAD